MTIIALLIGLLIGFALGRWSKPSDEKTQSTINTYAVQFRAEIKQLKDALKGAGG